MAKEALQMNGSVSGRSRSLTCKSWIHKPGFSLIEVLVAIVIIGIMATIVMPRLLYKKTTELDTFIENISLLTQVGYEQAVITGQIHRLFFNMKADSPYIQLQVEKKEDGDKKQKASAPQKASAREFKPVSIAYITTQIPFDSALSIQNFFIKNIDEAQGGTLKDAWYYILPSGLSQEIIITIADSQKNMLRSLVLNPFTVKFSVYDTPQKP